MAAIIAAAAGACAPGCAGLLAAGGSFFSIPVLSAISVASVIGAALLRSNEDEDLCGSTKESTSDKRTASQEDPIKLTESLDAPKGNQDFF